MWAAYPAQLQDDLTLALRVTTSGQGEVSLEDRTTLRFHLPTLCCLGVGGTREDVQAVQTIWGLLYDASHLMDQVQDNDPGPLPAVDRTLAVATAAFFEANSRISALDQSTRTFIYQQMQRVVCGQAAEIYAQCPTVEESIRVAENKTSCYVSLGCSLGAMAGGGSEAQVEALATFGQASGMVFQILPGPSGWK